MSDGPLYDSIEDLADISADFQAFAKSNVGRYLLRMAEKEEIEVLRKLVKVPADDTQAILALQVQAEVPRRLLQFIDGVLKAGKLADWQLKQETNE